MDIIEKKLRKDLSLDKMVLKDWTKKVKKTEKLLELYIRKNGR